MLVFNSQYNFKSMNVTSTVLDSKASKAVFSTENEAKRILIDIKHPAQLNLFKGLARNLKEDGWQVIVCFLGRGKIPKIIAKEYPDFERIQVGSSAGTKWSIFWEGNVVRTSTFVKLIKKRNIDICIAASSAPLALAGKLTGTPVLQFYDDPERKGINAINAQLSNQIYFPPIVAPSKKIGVFNCLKEWSYLSPTYFTPNPKVLQKHQVEPRNYVFVREVSNKSFNYYNQQDAIICSFAKQIDPNIPVLLSLEDKSYQDQFPENWTVLQEPIEDIHSLIYYSKLMLASGDSMAREGAMLGVPSIYCGIREMKANELLIQKGILQHLPEASAVSAVNETIREPFDHCQQEKIRHQLLQDWDDMTFFMKNQIIKYIKQ
jgi:uncharacterized protein